MKKFVCVFLIAVMLCSCSEKGITPKLLSTSFTAEMVYYNEKYSFSGKISEDGTLTAKITSPEDLADLVFIITPEQTNVSYKGLTFSPVEGNMPFSSVMEEFYEPINEIASSEAELLTDSNGKLTGVEEREYTFIFSSTGLPQQLLIPDESFSVVFYNQKILNEDANE